MSAYGHVLRLPILRVLGRPILWRVVLIVAIVELIFLAEEFTGLLQLALRLDGDISSIARMLLFRMPEIFDLALAFGLLIATYFATTDARNRGELVVLATAGVAWWRVISVVFVIGLIGGVLNFINAGYLLPMSNFGERATVAELRKAHILNRIETPGNRTAVQNFDDTTFIASPAPSGAGTNGRLFVFQPDFNGAQRVATSQHWKVSEADGPDQHVVTLDQLQVYETSAQQQADAPLSRFSTATADFEFSMRDALPVFDSARNRAERLLSFDAAEGRRIARVASRSLMVPLAGLLALCALIVASKGGLARILALPLAATLMLCADITARALIPAVAQLMGWPALAATTLAIYLGPPLLFLIWNAEALMVPSERDQ